MKDKITYISGPANIIRLEGKIYNTKKVIYLFYDFHKPVHKQTQCNILDGQNQDVKQYIYDGLCNTTKVIDLFVEITKSEQHDMLNYVDLHTKKERYINEVRSFLPIIKNKKLNARYHYIDIRDNIYFSMNSKIHLAFDMLHQIYTTNNYVSICDILNSVKKDLMYTNDKISLKPKYNKPEPATKNKEEIDNYEKMFDKIMNRYNHHETKTKLEPLFSDILVKIQKSIDIIDNTLKLIKGAMNTKTNKMLDEPIDIDGHKYMSWDIDTRKHDLSIDKIRLCIEDVDVYVTVLYSRLMDVYYMRRFIDKDYITSVVSYTGANHANMYLYLLVKYFGFKITNASHIENMTNEELERHIKKVDNIKDMYKIEKVVYPKVFIQCSNIKGFPDNFE